MTVGPISRRRLVKGRTSARRCDLAMLEMIILQVAFARLVANRAVDRMVDQQIFFDQGPALPHVSLSVTITVPSLAGVWQAGTSLGTIVIAPVSGLRVPVSTRHIRQLATTVSPGMPTIVGNVDAAARRRPECHSSRSWSPTSTSLSVDED